MTSWLFRNSLILCVLLFPVSISYADGYVQLVGIPGLEAEDQRSLGAYTNALYRLSIGIAAILAVLRIIFAGAKYIFTDVVPTKSDAKNDIRNAIIGLLVVICAVLLLNTINPQLTNLDALSNLKTSITTLDRKYDIPIPNAVIGSIANTCTASTEEIDHLTKTCPGVINRVHDAASGCVNIRCDEKKNEVPTLSCSGNSCTCDFESSGSSACVSQCRVREGYHFLTHTINESSKTVTCTFTPTVPESECSVAIGCCYTTSPVCPQASDSRVCRTDNSILPGQVCYYTR